MSVTERGALSARDDCVLRMYVGVLELQARGRNDGALALALGARSQASELPVIAIANLATMHFWMS